METFKDHPTRCSWLGGLLLVFAVVLAYQPVWYAGYVWDDDFHLTTNSSLVGPVGFPGIWTLHGDLRAFPLTITTFWVEHMLWGLAPLPYHLVNVLMHGACAVVLWRLLRALQIPGAWLGAALWALHPLQVESTAWISELKNTQSGLFYLLTLLFYARWLKAGGKKSYIFMLVFAAMAMASKSATLVLPAMLALCGWWIEGRWSWRRQIALAPVVLMSIVALVVTVWPQPSTLLTSIADAQWGRSLPERVATSGDVIWFYLGKLLWPHPLMTMYPRWKIDATEWESYLPLLAAILLLFILWLKRGSWGRPWFFAWAYFLVALAPFLGLVEQSFWRFSFVEDHLQYLAGIGPLALAGAGLARLADVALPQRRWLPVGLATGLLLVLGTASWRQTWIYQSKETLWADAVAKNPACWAGYYNLGIECFGRGRPDEAMALYQKALELNPRYEDARVNYGVALIQKGRVREAISQFQQAVSLDPDDGQAQHDLAQAEAMARNAEKSGRKR